MAERRAVAATIPLDLLDFLLGVARSPAEIEALHTRGVSYDGFATFEWDYMPAPAFLELWHRHSSALHAEARRRGVEVPDPMRYRPGGCWARSMRHGEPDAGHSR